MSSTFCLVMLFWMGFGATSREIVVGLAQRWDILEDIEFSVGPSVFCADPEQEKEGFAHTTVSWCQMKA